MRALQPWHIIVLVVVILLVFGANKLPDLARSVGQSMKIFKNEVKDLKDSPAAKDGAETKTVADAPTVADTTPSSTVADAPTRTNDQPPTA